MTRRLYRLSLALAGAALVWLGARTVHDPMAAAAYYLLGLYCWYRIALTLSDGTNS